MKIEGTKKQKRLLIVQVILLIMVIIADVLINRFGLNNILLVKISEYGAYMVIFVLPFIVSADEEKENKDNK